MTLAPTNVTTLQPDIRSLADVRGTDTQVAGGKGANLGELIATGLPTPEGFVICAGVWTTIRDSTGLVDDLTRIFDGMQHTDTEDLEHRCREAMTHARHVHIPQDIAHAIEAALGEITSGDTSVIVRSSATLEDTAAASFAGMNTTVANVRGRTDVMNAVRSCWSSLFAPRSVFYRAEHGFPIARADIAVVVQRYVPATRSGVMFTRDPAGDDPDRMVIEAAFGGGEAVVSGRVTPDGYIVVRHPLRITERVINEKTVRTVDGRDGGTEEIDVSGGEARMATLDDLQVMEIARLGMRIDMHFRTPQDIEWLFDNHGRPWIVQSRPITHGTQQVPVRTPSTTITQGIGASGGRASGRACLLNTPTESQQLKTGDVLVAPMTAPDWIPVLRRASAIVTDAGGVTCHAAIVARELGIPCVVGTGNATHLIESGRMISVDGDRGIVSDAIVSTDPQQQESPTAAPTASSNGKLAVPTATRVMVNLSTPDMADALARGYCDGIGLIRAEQMIVDALDGHHPLEVIATGGIDDAARTLADTIRSLAAPFAPRPVTYRTVDFRSNEFRNLVGGEIHEPMEANPMIGSRGAGRYVRQPELLQLEACALRMLVESHITNIRVMLPFVRTPSDVTRCVELLRSEGVAVIDEVELWIMAEVPSIRWHLAELREIGVTGISIGSNDLTQLLLGVDRDSAVLTGYDASDTAVVAWIRETLHAADSCGLATSICGQAPVLHPQYVDELVNAGIGSISVSPDALEQTRYLVACAEMRALQNDRQWGQWGSNPRPTD